MKNYKKTTKIITDREYQEMLMETAKFRNALLFKYSYLSEFNRNELKSELETAVYEALASYNEANEKGASVKTYVERFMEWRAKDFLCNFAHGGISISHDDWSIRNKITKAREENPQMSESELAELLGISVRVLRTHLQCIGTISASTPLKGHEDDGLTVEDTLSDHSSSDEPKCYQYKDKLEAIVHTVLTEKEAKWFIEANGLFGTQKKSTEQIGKECGGVTHQYVSKVNKSSFDKIQNFLLKEDEASHSMAY